jgi:V/A-type H+/Na+-transporting ATPase subunit E
VSVKGGLSAIASEVLGDVQKEAEAIIADAQLQAKEALQQAKTEAEKQYAQVMAEAKTKAEAEGRKIASLTEVEMRNSLLSAKETLVEAAFRKAIENLGDFVKTGKYHTYLTQQIESSTQKIASENLIVQVNSQDKKWLTQQTLNKIGKKHKITLQLSKETLDCIGGCKIQSVDGKIVYDNTLDHRLEELRPELRVEAAKILFGRQT